MSRTNRIPRKKPSLGEGKDNLVITSKMTGRETIEVREQIIIKATANARMIEAAQPMTTKNAARADGRRETIRRRAKMMVKRKE